MRSVETSDRQSPALPVRLYGMWLALSMLLAGCGVAPRLPAPGVEQTPVFRPPTISAPATATIIPVSARPTTALNCTDKLAFVADLTIPDGTVVAPNSTLDKRWEVENIGTCNWDERYHLKLASGPAMGIEAEQPLFPARSGTRAIIRLVMQAPEKPGTYRSAWQAYNPNNEKFGEVFFIDIVVK